MAFSANVLLYLDDYCDVDLLEKTLNEPDSEPGHSIEKILADAVTAVSNFDADNIEGYWPCEIATPVEYILGLEKPEELVNYTNNMQAEARKAAHALIKAQPSGNGREWWQHRKDGRCSASGQHLVVPYSVCFRDSRQRTQLRVLRPFSG